MALGRKGWKYGYCHRRPRTHQEMVANDENRDEYYEGERTKWGRRRRNKWALDPWNNEPRHTIQKSWKNKRRTQYRIGKRGQPVEIICKDYKERWELQEYCEKHDIPYKVEYRQKFVTKIKYIYKWDFIVGWKDTWIPTGYNTGFYHKWPIIETFFYDPPWVEKHRVCVKGTYIFTHWRPKL